MSYNFLSNSLILFWSWFKSTFTDYEDDISYGFKLEQDYQKSLKKKLND